MGFLSLPDERGGPIRLRLARTSTEYPCDRLLFQIRHQVAIPAPLLLRAVADELVDDPLVNPGRGQATDERVPQYVVALEHLPLATGQGPLQVVVCLVAGHGGDGLDLP